MSGWRGSYAPNISIGWGYWGRNVYSSFDCDTKLFRWCIPFQYCVCVYEGIMPGFGYLQSIPPPKWFKTIMSTTVSTICQCRYVGIFYVYACFSQDQYSTAFISLSLSQEKFGLYDIYNI